MKEVEAIVERAIPTIIEKVVSQVATSLDAHSSKSGPQPNSRAPESGQGQHSKGSSQQSEENDSEDEVEEILQDHLDKLSKESTSDEDSDVEVDVSEFKYYLTEREVISVRKEEYLDFEKIHRRVHRKTGGPKVNVTLDGAQFEFDASQTENKTSSLTIQEWIYVFLSFQAEHVRLFPKDGPVMPKYMELILSMSERGLDWRKYDENFRMSRAKWRRIKGTRKTGICNWNKTNIELYLACSNVQKVNNVQQSRQSVTPQTKSTPISRSSYRIPNTCWRYQEEVCSGACQWPDTHHCFICMGNHPTSKHSLDKEGQRSSDARYKQPFRSSRPERQGSRSGRPDRR